MPAQKPLGEKKGGVLVDLATQQLSDPDAKKESHPPERSAYGKRHHLRDQPDITKGFPAGWINSCHRLDHGLD